MLGLAGTLLVPAALNAQETPDLTGRYKIVSGGKDGAATPQGNIDDTLGSITRDRIVVTDRDEKETYSASYTIDAKQTPWRISMVSRGAPEEDVDSKGLIERRGDTLRLIYAVPGGRDPIEFETGPQQQMFVMQASQAAP